MSTIPTNVDIKPYVIKKFLGLNLTTTGDTQIQDGESGNMTNFVITNDYKLRKCNGYKKVHDFGSQIKGTYKFNTGSETYLLVVVDGNLYKISQTDLNDETKWDTINFFDVEDNTYTFNNQTYSITNNVFQISTTDVIRGNVNIRLTDYTPYNFDTTKSYVWSLTIKSGVFKKTENPLKPAIFIKYSDNTETTSKIQLDTNGQTFASETLEFRSGKTPVGFAFGVYAQRDSIDSNVNAEFYVQLEEGSQPTPYVPYTRLNPTLIGSVGDYDTTFFSFDKKVYLLNGHKYYSYDGTTLTEVEGYTPLVFVNAPPSGGGTDYDPINILSPKKHMTFNADGTSSTYQLAQKGISSVDKVIVNGTEIASTGYSVNTTNGTVTFTNIPTAGTDNVDIYWSKTDGDRGLIEGMRAGIVYGGDVDTKVFLYGHATTPNRVRYSATAGGVPSAEYFPATNLVDVGPSNFAVTDLTRQYDRLIATTNRPEAYTLGIDLIDVNGYSTPSVVTLPLNEVHGNIAFAQGQVINNEPVTVEKGQLIRWKSTSIRDERNMEVISDKIRDELVELDLSACKTCDFQDYNQLWIAIGTKVYIYNYYNKTYSRLSLPVDSDLFQVVGRSMYMTDMSGNLYKFDANYQTFDTEIIKAHWEMNFSNFGLSYLRKTMRKLWVLMQPQVSSSAEIGYVSNRNESPVKKTISYKLTFFDDADFANWSFKVSNDPQPFRLKLKAKKFTNLKVTIDNENTDDCTILELALKVETNGESK